MVEPHGSLLFAFALTVFSLVVLPGQWVPVLFRDDLTVIDLSLVALAIGAVVTATASTRRSVGEPGKLIAVLAALATALVIAATILYKVAFDAIGWPEPHELALGVAFVLAAGGIGIVLGKLQRGRSRVVTSVTTGLVALVTGSFGVWLFTTTIPKMLEPTYTASAQECVTRTERYCYNAGYLPFVDDWKTVVDAVLAAVPVEVDRSEILIAQLLDEDGRRAPGVSAAPGLDLGKGAGKGVAELGFGLEVANWVTGLKVELVLIDPGEPLGPCDPGTTPRSVIAYWLAGQVSHDAEQVLRDLGCCADAINGSTFASPAIGGGWQLAAQLLDRPRDEVASLVRRHWDELVEPQTALSRLEGIFGITIQPEASEPGDPDGGIARCESRFDDQGS